MKEASESNRRLESKVKELESKLSAAESAQEIVREKRIKTDFFQASARSLESEKKWFEERLTVEGR
eukprot:CAMPEP_0170502798 /NCGR_PEP_ID=MMETSP0208-20121228/42575_1 /TAXON_ID=197538 /ORGANISM="Strombidium inclinatum, Strain S3" /LENGTH=65 /DNA_ID=CAMNT_0010782071 /DNA_START=73 /DNA_END=266 /DNA_ORIENTATION=-